MVFVAGTGLRACDTFAREACPEIRPSPAKATVFLVSPTAATIFAIIVSALAVAILLRTRSRLPQAIPGERSLHDRPTPRVGGLAIWAGFVPAAYFAPSPVPDGRTWLVAFAAIGLVSLLDDWRGVSAPSRLLVHAAASLAIVQAMFDPGMDPGAAEWLVAGAVALALVWSANLFNFMDGSDGLAATAALVGFAVYAAAGALAGDKSPLCFALAAAIVPFLAVNVPPARMFMGDVGSVPLGFLAGTFGIAGVWRGMWPAWFPLLVFLPLVADASVTLARRFFRGERVGLPHRSHYYQRFNRSGAGHRGTFWLFGGLCAGCGASALGVLVIAPELGWVALFTWTGIMAVIFAGIDYHWSRFTRAAR